MRAATPWGATLVIEHLPRAGPVIVQCWDPRGPPSAQATITRAWKNCATSCPCLSPAKAWVQMVCWEGLPGDCVKGGRGRWRSRGPCNGGWSACQKPHPKQLLDPESPPSFRATHVAPTSPQTLPTPSSCPCLPRKEPANRLLPALYPQRSV